MDTRDVGLRGVRALGWQLSRAICLPPQVGNMDLDTRDVGPRGVRALGWQISRIPEPFVVLLRWGAWTLGMLVREE